LTQQKKVGLTTDGTLFVRRLGKKKGVVRNLRKPRI